MLNLRGFAKFTEDLTPQEYQGAVLDGQMSFTINQSPQTEVFQSIIPITSMFMSQNLMNFFSQSEQVATQIMIAVDNKRVSGMLLQLLPGQDTGQREEFWEYATKIGQTVTADELLNLSNSEILYRLYHETELRLYSARPARFQCRCSEDKMKQALTVLGEADVNALLQEKGNVEVICDFCSQRYVFESIDVALLFKPFSSV